MIKKVILILITVICIIAIYVLIEKVKSGGFEKELVPAFTDSRDDWRELSGPMLKSQWRQDSVFAEFTPRHELLGCWSVAFAQVLAYNRLQPSGTVVYSTSFGDSINLSLIPARWHMVVQSPDSSSPAEYLSETARYCYQVATVVQKDFGQGDYKDISIVPDEISEHFKCSVSRYSSDLPEIITGELNSGRPVVVYFDDILGIKVVRNGHAAVLDGKARFNNDLYVHANLGWGGDSDGWYRLESLSKERKLKYIFTIKP